MWSPELSLSLSVMYTPTRSALLCKFWQLMDLKVCPYRGVGEEEGNSGVGGEEGDREMGEGVKNGEKRWETRE